MLLLEEWIRETRKAALLKAEDVLSTERYGVLRDLYRAAYPPLSQLQEFTLGTGRVCLVTGDAGIGKTFLCHQLISQVCQVGVEREMVPVYVSITKQASIPTLSIENIVRAQGISEGDIPQLKAEGRLLIILDGFADDERYANLFVSLKLYEWPKAKIVVTCRSSHLFHLSHYSYYFEPLGPQGQRLGKLTEIKMPLLSEVQLESYKQTIQAYSELRELLRHPFFLQCVIRNAEVSSSDLVESLLRAWFTWHEKRFREMGRLGVNETLGDKSFGFGIALARQMRKANVDAIVYKPRSMLFQTEDASGSAFFSRHDSRLNLLREMCPLVEVGSKRYQFLAQSLLSSYFADHRTIPALSLQEETVVKPRDVGEVPRTEPMPANPPNGLSNHYLNKRCMTDDSNIMQWFADRVIESTKFKELLFKLVLASRTDATMETAAANAITILNRAEVSFSGLDLRNIRVRYANLEGANFDSAILSGADLRDVNLQNAWLRNADLSGAKMQGVKFGAKPHIESPPGAGSYFPYLSDGLLCLYVNKERNKLSVFNLKLATSICEIPLSEEVSIASDRSVAISKKAPLLAYLEGKGRVQIYDIERQLGICEIESVPESRKTNIYLSENGHKIGLVLSISDTVTRVQIWEIKTKTRLYEIEIGVFRNVEFNANLSEFVYFNNDGVIHSCDTLSDEKPKILSHCNWGADGSHKEGTTGSGKGDDDPDIADKSLLSDSCKLLFRCNEHGAQIWQITDGKLLWTTEAPASHAVFSANEKYIAIALGKSITFLDIELAKIIKLFDATPDNVTFLIFTQNGKQLISFSERGIVRTWDVSYENSNRAHTSEKKKRVDKVLFSPDGRILAISRWGIVDIFSAHNFQLIATFEIDKWKIVDMAFSPNNKYLAILGHATSAATLFDVSEFPTVKKSPQLFSAGFHLNNEEIEDVATYQLYQKESFNKYSPVSFREEDFGNLPAVDFTDKKSVLLGWISLVQQAFSPANFFLGYEVKSIAISDDHLMVGNSDGSCHSWSLESPESFSCSGGGLSRCEATVITPEVNSDRMYWSSALTSFKPFAPCMVIYSSEDKSFALTRTDGIMIVPDFTFRNANIAYTTLPMIFESKSLKDHTEIAICPDANSLAVVSSGVLLLWFSNAPDEYIEFAPTSDKDKITCVSFSSDSKYLSFGCLNNKVYLWNMKLKRYSYIVNGFAGAIRNISWRMNGSKLYFSTSSVDDVARYWEVIDSGSYVNVVLRWSDSQLALVAQDAYIDKVEEVELENKQLLIQHGAISKVNLLSKDHCITLRTIPIPGRITSYQVPMQDLLDSNTYQNELENLGVSPEERLIIEQGDIFVAIKDLTKAITYFQRAVELSQSYLPYQRIGYCYWLQALKVSDQNDIVKSRENFEAAIELVASTQLYVLYAHYLFQQKHFDNALPYLERVFNTVLIEDNYQFKYSAYNSVLLPNEIKEEVDEAVDMKLGAIPLAYYLIVNCYCSLNQKPNAIKFLDEFSKWVGSNASALHYSLLGYCHKLLEQYSEAVACFSQAIELSEDYKLAKRNLQSCSGLLSLKIALSNLQTTPQKSSTGEGVDDDGDDDDELQRAMAMSLHR